MVAEGGEDAHGSRVLLAGGGCRWERRLRGWEQEATRWLGELQRKQTLALAFVDEGDGGPNGFPQYKRL